MADPVYQVTVVDNQNIVVKTGIQGPPGPGVDEVYNLYAEQIDFVTDDLFYRGEALAGSLTSDPAWRIRKVETLSGEDVMQTWADGNTDFDNVWDDRLTLSYS